MRLFILARHAHSTLNVESRVNGDPSVEVPLTEDGRAQAELLGEQVARLPIDLCVHSRFGRTLETARLAIGHRDIPLEEEPLLDDIDVGELEGASIEAYRAWKRDHARSDAFPGGESLDDASHRYSRAFAKLVARTEQTILVVCHEIPVRYALNTAFGSADPDAPVHAIPNATPYLFDEPSLRRAAAQLA